MLCGIILSFIKMSVVMLSFIRGRSVMLKDVMQCHYAEFHKAECCYVDCPNA